MAEQPGLSDQYSRASPWPVFVAFGLVLSEAGVLFGAGPVAVGGLLLLAGSVVGILRESGFASTLWRSAGVVGSAYAILGGLLVRLTAADARGSYVLVSGGVVLAAAVVLWLVESGRL